MADPIPPTPATAAPPETEGPFSSPILNQARRRWDRASEWEAQARQRFIEDVKFANGDAYNKYQWPNQMYRARDVGNKPCLTLNVTKQHNIQIINEMKRNKTGVVVKPVGNSATAEAAEIWQAVIRHVEYRSKAQLAYACAQEFQVDGGIGWWRITTEYAEPDTFDQEIRIAPVPDPLCIYTDPDAKERNGSDANWAFFFDLVPKAEFDEAYPELRDIAGLSPLNMGGAEGDWVTRDHIRIAEYFRREPKADKLMSFIDPASQQRKSLLKSLMPPGMWEELEKEPLSKTRETERVEVEWYLIVGDQIADRTIWPGRYIPLIKAVGQELVIEGVLDRKGHTRALLDGQRMFNYNASAQVETVNLQGKSPIMAPAAAIEEYTAVYRTLNTENPAVLPWNHIDEAGNPIPPPQRLDPPKSSEGYQTGMETATKQMMMASGQYENAKGEQGNERTGAAIGKRQDQAENATYHFRDNFENALVFTGVQLLDLIPKIYDTKRVLRMQAEDGQDMEVEIDPAARQAFAARLGHDGQIIRRIFNPAVGRYDVTAQAGAAFGSWREQTVEAMGLVLTQAPALAGIGADLLISAMDFKGATEFAQRLRRMVPPQALGQGPTPKEQQLQAQITALTQALGKSLQKQGKDVLKLVGKQEMRDIDVYKAETDRFKALADQLPMDQQGLLAAIHQLVNDSIHTNLLPIIEANRGDIGMPDQPETKANGLDAMTQGAGMEQPPVPGSQKAPDGEWYLADPTRKGKYLRIGPLAQDHSQRSVIK